MSSGSLTKAQLLAENERLRVDLAESERRRAALETMFDSMADPVLVYDAGGTVVSVNEASRRDAGVDYTGMTVAQLIDGFDVIHPDGRKMAVDEVPTMRALHGEAVSSVRYDTLRAGRRRKILGSAAPIRSGDEITGVVTILHDVTEREQALDEAADRLDEMDAIFSAVTDPILVWDANGRVLRGSDAVADLTGVDLTGRTLPEVAELLEARLPDGSPFPVDDGTVAQALRDHRTVGFRFDITNVRGESRRLVSSASPWRRQGAIVGSVVVYHDVTDREGAVDAARKRLDEMDAVFAALADPLIVFDADLRVVRCNGASTALVGGDLLGKTAAELMESLDADLPDGAPMSAEGLPLVHDLRNDEVFALTFALTDVAGRRRKFTASAAPLLSMGEAVGAVAVFHDVTDLDRLATEATRSYDELETVFSAVNDPIVVWDADMRIVRCNAATTASVGGADLVGMTMAEASRFVGSRLPDGSGQLLDGVPVAHALLGETTTDYRFDTTGPDGKAHNIISSASPLVSGGEIVGAVVVYHDITDLERLTVAARTHAEELETVLATIADSVIVWDSELRIVRCNEATRASAGFDPVGKSAPELAVAMQPSLADGSPIPLTQWPAFRALHGERVQNFRMDLNDVRTGRRKVTSSAAPLMSEGKVTGVVAIFHDITDTDRLAEEMQSQANLLDAVVSSIADGVVVYNLDGSTLRTNDAARAVLGYTDEQMTLSLADRLRIMQPRWPNGEPVKPDEAPAARALRGESGSGLVMAVHRQDPDRDVWVSLSYAPALDATGGVVGAVVTYSDITPVVEAQREAQRHAAELEAVLDAIPDGVAFVNPDNTIRDVNSAGRRIMGYDEATLGLPVGQRIATSRLRHADGRALLPDETPGTRALLGETVTGLPLSVTRADGEDALVVASAAPVRDLDGNIVGAVTSLTDVTALTVAEREAQRRATELEAIVDSMAGGGIVLLDRDAKVTRISPALRRLLGYGDQEDLTRPFSERIGPMEARDIDGRVLAPEETPTMRSLAGETVEGFVLRFTALDGRDVVVVTTTTPLRDADGEITGVVAVMSDITELTLARDELARASTLLRSVVDRMPAGLLAWDADGTPLIINDYLRNMLGGGPIISLDRPVARYTMHHPDGTPIPIEDVPIMHALRDRETLTNVEIIYRLESGAEVHGLASSGPLLDAEGKLLGAVAVIRDITELTHAQDELARTSALLRSIIDTMPAGLLAWDADGETLFINDYLRSMLGGSSTNTATHRAEGYTMHRPDGSEISVDETPLMHALRDGETSRDVDLVFHLQDGRYVHALSSSSPLRDASGEILGAVAVLRDVTRLRRLEAEREGLLRQVSRERALLRSVIDQMPLGTTVGEAPSGKLLFTNRQHDEIWGGFATADRIAQYEAFAGFHPDGTRYESWEWPLSRALSAGEVVRDEIIEILRFDGTRRITSQSAAPIYDEEGELIAGVVTLMDVTERLEMAEAVRRQAAELETVLNSITGGGVILVDRTGNIVRMSAVLREMLEYGDADESRGLSERARRLELRDDAGRLLAPEDTPAARALRGESVTGFPLHFHLSDRTVVATTSAEPLRDASGLITGAVVALTDITQLHRQQAELERTTALLRTILDTMPIGVVSWDADGEPVLVNDACRAMLHGEPMSASAGKTVGRTFHRGDGSDFPVDEVPIMRALRRKESVRDEDVLYRYPDGSEVRVQISATPMIDAEGRVLGAVATFHDVTELRGQQVELEHTNDLLHSVVETMPAGLIILGPDGEPMIVNERLREILRGAVPTSASRDAVGYTVCHLDGTPYDHDDLTLVRAFRRGETARDVELLYRLDDGTEVFAQVSSGRLVDAAGNLRGAVSVIQDITGRKRQEAELERLLEQIRFERERLFSVLSMLPGYVCLLTPECDVAFANQGFVDLFGDPGEQKCHQALFGLDEKCPWCESFDCLKSGQPKIWEWLSPNDTTFLVHDYPFIDLDGTTLVLEFGIDITERKRQQAELERTTELLRTILATMPVGLVVWDAQGEPIVINDYWREALRGTTPLSESNRVPDRLVLKVDGTPLPFEETPFQRALVGRQTVRDFPITYRFGDGTELGGLISASPLSDAAGGSIGALAVFRDLTQLQRQQAELERTSALLSAVLNSIADGVAVYTPDGSDLLTNAAARRIMGLADEDGTPTSAERSRLLHPHWPSGEPVNPVDFPSSRALRGEAGSGLLLAFTAADTGAEVWISAGYAPALDDDGNLVAAVSTFTEVTALVEAQREAERTSEMLSTLIDTMPGGVAATDAEGNWIVINQTLRDMLRSGVVPGAGSSPLAGLRMLHPDGSDFLPEEMPNGRAVHLGETLRNLEMIWRYDDGDEIYVLIAATPIRDRRGAILGEVSVAFDITERKRQEAELARTSETLHGLIETMPSGVMACGAQGLITLSNEAMRTILGGGVGVTAGQSGLGYTMHRPDGTQYGSEELPLFRAIHQGVATSDLEIVFHRADGVDIFTLVSGTPLFDAAGKLTGAVAVVYDITDLHDAHLELERHRDHLEALVRERTVELAERSRLVEAVFENTPSGLALLDLDFNFLRVNDGYAQMAHRTPEELVGRNHFDIFPSDDLRDTFEQVIRNGLMWHTQGRPVAPNPFDPRPHDTYWDLSVVPILDSKGNVEAVLYALRDVTEREEAARQLRTLAAELALAEERERRRIATGIHDEISQTLAFAKLRVESLRQAEEVEDLGSAVDEIVATLAEVLQYTRDLTFEISPPVLYQLGFDAALDWLGEEMGKRHGFAATLTADDQPRPLAEDTRVVLFQAVRELLNNVAKHAQATEVEIRVATVGQEVEVAVVDNGVGYDPSERKPGVVVGGYGLFDIQERLAYLGGRLEVRSAPGEGATFTLYAPLLAE